MERISSPNPYAKEEVVGLDKEMDALRDNLLKDVKDVAVIVIKGKPGIGKTMVAQCLYDDPQVVKSFGQRYWISVASIYRTGALSRELMEFVKYHYTLNDASQKCLVVLDDWSVLAYRNMIPDVLQALRGFKVIITTSNSSDFTRFCTQMNQVYKRSMHNTRIRKDATFHSWEGLAEDKSWNLFERTAFTGQGSEEERARILESKIGEKICTKCGNNPRVIKTVAEILSSKHTLEEWKHFDDVVWQGFRDPVETIQSKLNKDCFKRLPYGLKRVLAFLSLFPKDYEFCSQNPVFWIEAGFFKPLANETKPDLFLGLDGDEHLRELHRSGYSFQQHEVYKDTWELKDV